MLVQTNSVALCNVIMWESIAVCIVHTIDMYTCISHVPAQQIHNDESQEAFEDSGYFSKISDKSVGTVTISTF